MVDNGDVYDFMLFFQSFNLLQENLMSVTKIAGEYNLLINECPTSLECAQRFISKEDSIRFHESCQFKPKMLRVLKITEKVLQ
jgi:hypothetical protein